MQIPREDMTPSTYSVDNVNAAWWTSDEKQVHMHSWNVARRLYLDGTNRRNDNVRNARLYSNRAFLQLSITPYRQPSAKPLSDSARLTLNVIKSCVDTASAKISQARPKPSFLTSGGDWKLQRRARQLSKYVEGLFMAEGVYGLGQTVFRDSLVFGTGVLKVLNNGKSVTFERVLPDELLVDEGESFYGLPRQLHHRRFVQRDMLAAKFPEHAEAIKMAQHSFGDEDAVNPNLIAVVESWHLRSTPDATDGRRVVAISTATLVDEAWERDSFPFAFLRWTEPLVGFWGMGLSEELTGIQLEINKILRNIQSAQNICSVPRVFIENGSQINGASLQANPEGLSVVRYNGQAPTFLTASAMPGEVYAHLDRLERKAYEITGVSQMAAQSRKPAGLDSGVALREFNDIESERFVLVGQRWERFFLDLAELVIAESKALFEANPDLNVRVNIKGSAAEYIRWKDVRMEEDQYLLQCFPTSLLPSTPAGRLQKVQELMQAGFIGKEEGLALLDFPDLERSMSLTNSAYNDLMQMLERIVEAGEYESPEPYLNLPLAIQLGQSMYLRSRSEGVPEDRLELLRRFIGDCETLMKEAEAPVAAPVAATLATPEAPPASDLLPFG
jgi:hypothetical protein